MSVEPLLGINVQLAVARRNAALANMDTENAALRGSGFSLDAAVAPHWNRSVWDQYKAQFGKYPFDANNKPPDVTSAPPWVKKLCGIALTPAERMGSN